MGNAVGNGGSKASDDDAGRPLPRLSTVWSSARDDRERIPVAGTGFRGYFAADPVPFYERQNALGLDLNVRTGDMLRDYQALAAYRRQAGLERPNPYDAVEDQCVRNPFVVWSPWLDPRRPSRNLGRRDAQAAGAIAWMGLQLEGIVPRMAILRSIRPELIDTDVVNPGPQTPRHTVPDLIIAVIAALVDRDHARAAALMDRPVETAADVDVAAPERVGIRTADFVAAYLTLANLADKPHWIPSIWMSFLASTRHSIPLRLAALKRLLPRMAVARCVENMRPSIVRAILADTDFMTKTTDVGIVLYQHGFIAALSIRQLSATFDGLRIDNDRGNALAERFDKMLDKATVLGRAVVGNVLSLVQFLMERRVSLRVFDRDNNPLWSRVASVDMVNLLAMAPGMKMLINQVNKDSHTPLDLIEEIEYDPAIYGGEHPVLIAQALMEHGARVGFVGVQEHGWVAQARARTAFGLALLSNRIQGARLLKIDAITQRVAEFLGTHSVAEPPSEPRPPLVLADARERFERHIRENLPEPDEWFRVLSGRKAAVLDTWRRKQAYVAALEEGERRHRMRQQLLEERAAEERASRPGRPVVLPSEEMLRGAADRYVEAGEDDE